MQFLTSVAAIGIVGVTSSYAILFGGFDYTLTMSEITWEMAEAEAVANGGHLASITSIEEQEFIIETFGSVGDLWIGLNDIETEGTFAWTDGTNFDGEVFNFWHTPYEPNGFTSENVVELRQVWDGDWNDAPGTDLQFGIIKTEVTPGSPGTPTNPGTSVPDTGGSLLLFGTGLAALVAARKKARR